MARHRIAPIVGYVRPTFERFYILIAFSQFAESGIGLLLSLLEHVFEFIKLVNVLSVLSFLNFEDHPLLPDHFLLPCQFMLLVEPF